MKASAKQTMKRNATRRLRVAMAILLALTLSPLVGGLAFATGSTGEGDGAGSTSGTTTSGVAAATVDNATAVADADTIWSWNDLIGYTTKNVGRIWTDKSVVTDQMSNGGITVKKADGSDFLTALTALSSTSNLSSTSTTPLDIVLVLDTSSSMVNNSITTSDGSSETRLAALKDAANSFVGSIAEKNSGVTDENKQHRVAVVSFNFSATISRDMTPCVGDKATAIQTAISNLGYGQGTHSDYGLQKAGSVLNDWKRVDAKQIVVFFTDGVPTTSGNAETNFDPAIASPAVASSRAMKDAGATIYTIGIIDTANPSADPTDAGTSNANKFLHAVSSNYPDATYVGSGSGYVWTFGDRAKSGDEDATFYKSATTAAELSQIFDDISDEITKDAGYPTKTTEGYESTSGYITFTDQLGDYMRVTDLSTLVYNATVYRCGEPSTMETTGGSIDTYRFSGTVDAGLKSGDLKDIIVTVTRSNNAATGDLVQVEIPATLIPLRNFEVDLTDNTMSATSKTPVSVFYSSGLKDEVAGLLVQPDEAMTKYIADNPDKTTGKVNFYANKWSDDKDLGDVTSQFEPSSGNSYYYFTENTPIYEDERCTTRATSIVDGTTYYYQHTYYELKDGTTDEQTGVTSGTPEAQTEVREFPGSAAKAFEGAIGTDENGSYFKKGTARLVYINELHKDKGEGNVTQTAADVLNPKWNSTTSVAAATTVTPHLGNNGKLSVDKPATLEVSKAITVPDGYDATDFADTGFTFELNVLKAANCSFPAVVLDEDDVAVCDEFALAFDKDGKATQTIKPGETLQVNGLGAGWAYMVTEPADELPAGFTQTAPANGEGKAIDATGRLAAGQTAQASFTNSYAAEPVDYNAVANLGVYKVLEGRGWMESDVFAFKLEALTDGAPLPQDAQGNPATEATVTVNDIDASGHAAVSFGDITYTKAGEYTYQVSEVNAGKTVAGVTYTTNVAKFTVNVTDLDGQDNHTGKLVAAVALDSGNVEFKNTYEPTNASYDTANAGLNKVLEGRDWLESDSFTFTLRAVTDGAPLPQDAQGNPVTEATVTEDNADNFGFGTITFTQDMVAGEPNRTKVFEYEVSEVKGEISGIDYATNTATIKVTVTDDNEGALLAAVEVANQTFTNIFTSDLNYSAAGDMEIGKILNGHDMLEGQFTFEFSTDDAASAEKFDLKKSTIASPAAKDGQKATVSHVLKELRGGEDLIFTRADVDKTYKLIVKEKNNGAAGYEYDARIWTVEIDISCENNKIKATSKASSSKGDLTTWVYVAGERATNPVAVGFSNAYSASGSVPIAATKELTGRPLAEGEFEFSLCYEDGTAVTGQVVNNDANGNVNFGELDFDVEALNDLVGAQKATYTVDEQGNKTWTIKYIAKEETSSLPGGVSSAKDTIPFTVTVVDSGDGTLEATADAGTDGYVFKNVYGADPVPMALNGMKVLEFDDGLEPADITGKFTFTITSDDENAPMPKDSQGNPLTQVTNDKNGVVDFGSITFSLDDLNKALGYAASASDDEALAMENAPDEDGQPVDSAANGDVAATMDAQLNGGENAEATPVEENEESASVEQNGEPASAEENEEPAKEGAAFSGLVKVAYADEGAVYVDELKSGKVRTCTFTYRITETGTVAGVTNDAVNSKKVQFTLTDDGEGHFTVERVTPGDVAFTFNNSYSVEPVESSVSDQLTFTKVLEGRAQNAGEFTFELLEDNDVVAIGANDAAGVVTFEPVTYTEPGVHYYTAREVGAGTTVDGVTYDRMAFQVNTIVSDDGEGGLSVEHSLVRTDEAVFNNTYEASPTSVVIGASKVFKGKDLADGQFTFKLVGDGVELEAKNKADGTVAFPAIEFDAAGTYDFEMYEVNDGQANVAYDSAKHHVSVVVSDDGKGHLVAEVVVAKDEAIAFTNVYSEPAPSVQTATTVAKTNDGALQLAAGLTIVTFAAAGVAFAAKRRRS